MVVRGPARRRRRSSGDTGRAGGRCRDEPVRLPSDVDLDDIDTTGISDADLARDREPIDEDALADFLELCALVEARIGRPLPKPRRLVALEALQRGWGPDHR